jgi:hypothetical protein
VARRAGLRRALEAVSRYHDPIIIPPSPQLAFLKRSVTFGEEEFLRLLELHQASATALAPITTEFGTPQASDFEMNGGTLWRTPIVRTKDRWVVALPGALLSAAWGALITLAQELGVTAELCQAFHEAVWDSVSESLKLLDHDRPPFFPMPPMEAAECVGEGFFTLDTDKVLHVILITEPLRNYDSERPDGTWPLEPEMDLARHRICAVSDFCKSLNPPPSTVLSLVLVQGFGRAIATHLDLPGAADAFHIFMSAAHLETVAMLEAGDCLVLLKYARSCKHLHDYSSVICFSELDKLSLYFRNGHTFYLSDDGRPDVLSITCDHGGYLRQKVIQKLDWHAGRSYRPNYYTEVAALHGTRDIPLYVERRTIRDPGRRAAVLVEGLPRPLWVLGPSPNGAKGLTARGNIPFIFVSAVAYWIWQLTPSISAAIEAIAARDSIVIELSFDGDFSTGAALPSPEEIPPVEVEASPYSAKIFVTIRPPLMGAFNADDNVGERDLMGHVLRGLSLLLTPAARPLLSEAVFTQVLDRHAPLGRKKMILPLNQAKIPTLDPAGLPDLRLVQEADEAVVLDELGEHLTQTTELPTGPIAGPKRNEVLHECARFLFEALESYVATLDPRGLLEWLVAHHEALLKSIETTRLTIPTRLQCFSSMPEMISRIGEELPARYKASVAARMVIEYVTAKPPNGKRFISLEAYDRVVALASEIIRFGQLSDTFKYNISDVNISILPSGRLGFGRDQFQVAREAFVPVHAHGEIARAMRSFRRYWQAPDQTPERPALADVMDAAARAEFGFSLTEIGNFLGECLAVGREINPAVCCMPVARLREHVANALEWPESHVVRMTDLLSLGPRPYLPPPKPFECVDVYPWRFNRELSYIRRPFLRRDTAESQEIVWGPRQLFATHENLLGLCMTGRLRAKSAEMKKLAGRLLNEQGEEFNDEVAEVLSRDKRLLVRPRLKKIPALRGQLEQLGDIDVFVIDASKRWSFVVECKDLEGARTPFEMGNELTNFFMGTEQKRSIIDKHQGRVRWVAENLDEVLGHFQIVRTGKWKIGSLIVIDRELFTPFLRASPVPIIPLERIRAEEPHRLGELLRGLAVSYKLGR